MLLEPDRKRELPPRSRASSVVKLLLAATDLCHLPFSVVRVLFSPDSVRICSLQVVSVHSCSSHNMQCFLLACIVCWSPSALSLLNDAYRLESQE